MKAFVALVFCLFFAATHQAKTIGEVCERVEKAEGCDKHSKQLERYCEDAVAEGYYKNSEACDPSLSVKSFDMPLACCCCEPPERAEELLADDTDKPVPVDTDKPVPVDTDKPVPVDTDKPVPVGMDKVMPLF